ncbi:hypothetical protein ACHAWC_005793 [Mediolabrus comicus]
MYQSQPRRNNTTNTTTTPAAELRHYYAIRPKLRKYTLGVELTRMEYTLILENGKCTSDKDVIRSYFGVNDDGERIMMSSTEEEKMEDEEATVEELLIRSANQSLLADALAALTGSEEDVVDRHTSDDDFFDDANDEQQHGVEKSMGLILSGPTLCMTSVAETCQFTIDLHSGKVEAICDLAISVPFHGDVSTVQDLLSEEQLQQHGENGVVENGRIVLAKAKISVRFRPGEGVNDFHDEPTVQYVVQSVKSLHAPNSPILRHVAIALAHDQEDPFFQEEQRADVGDATDIRDLFLLNHHLLSDSGLLAVSDHLERLRGAAEAKSTGFRSALRQLDGVTNVSGKLQFLKGTANAGQGSGSGSGFLGLGLALPSAEAIEAAEREAHGAVVGHNDSGFRFPRPDEINNEGHRFPRPNDVNEGNSRPYDDHRVRPTPPPPPPPPHLGHTPQTEQDVTRPQPIIGGLFMSGLSRLAAAATQPSDTRNEGDWAEEGGTGLTPPSSPMANRSMQAPTNDFPTLYRKEEDIKNTSQPQVEGGREVLGLSSQPSASKPLTGPPTQTHLAQESGNGRSEHSGDVDGDDDGWSDDEFDFEENANEDFLEEQQEIGKEEGEKVHTATISPTTFADNEEAVSSSQQGPKSLPSTTISAVIQARIERENKEILESGRLKRWTPLTQDPLVRQRLMEVMINTLRH